MKVSAYKGKITKLFNTFSHVIDELMDSGVLDNRQSREQQIQIILNLKVHVRGVMIKEESGHWEYWSDLNEYANYVCNDLDKIIDLVHDMANGNETIKKRPHFDYKSDEKSDMRSYEISNRYDLLAFQTGIKTHTTDYQNSK
jgi:hypothetical protein